MNNRTLIYMTGTALVAVAFLFAVNFMKFGETGNARYMPLFNVRSIEVVQDAKPYFLDLGQQKEMMDYLNRAIPVGKELAQESAGPANFSKIVITPYDGPKVEITPIAYTANSNLLLSIPEWNKDGLIKDVTQGKLKNLIDKSFEQPTPPAK